MKNAEDDSYFKKWRIVHNNIQKTLQFTCKAEEYLFFMVKIRKKRG